MSSRRVKTVEPSCGTNAIGASLRILRQVRIGIGPERRHVDLEMRRVGHGVRSTRDVRPGWSTSLFGCGEHVDCRRPNRAGSCCAGCAPTPRARARRGCGCRRSGQRLQHEFALDLADGRADQQRHDLVWGQRSAGISGAGTADSWVIDTSRSTPAPNAWSGNIENNYPQRARRWAELVNKSLNRRRTPAISYAGPAMSRRRRSEVGARDGGTLKSSDSRHPPSRSIR